MTDWQARAACKNRPEFQEATITKDMREMCSHCPVMAQCKAAAFEEERGKAPDHRHLLRGGLSPKERYKIDAGKCGWCGVDTPIRSDGHGGKILPGVSCYACSRRGQTVVNPVKVAEWERTCIQCGGMSDRRPVNGVCGWCEQRNAGTQGTRAKLRVA